MPPATKRDLCVVIYDLNTKPEFQELARKTLVRLISRERYFSGKNLMKLILTNCKRTRNSIYSANNQCKNINVCTGFELFSLSVMQHIDSAEQGEANWMEAVLVALKEMEEEIEYKGIHSRQIIFITDLSNSKMCDEIDEYIRKIKGKMLKEHYYLYILGPETVIPFTLKSKKDVTDWMREIKFVDEDNCNLKVASDLIQKVPRCIVCDLIVGLQMVKFYKTCWGMQPWHEPLALKGVQKMPCYLQRFLKTECPVKLSSNRCKVWHWVDAADSTVRYDHDDVVAGIAMHGKFVPMTADVKALWVSNTGKSFSLLGFTERKTILEHLLKDGGSHFVVPKNGRHLQVLIQVMFEKKLCALVQRVYRAKCKPKLSVLIPQPKQKRFVLCDLAYADQVRVLFDEEIDVHEETMSCSAQKDSVYDFLDSMDVSLNMKTNESKRLPLDFKLVPSLLQTILCERLANKRLKGEIDFDAQISHIILDSEIGDSGIAQKLSDIWVQETEISTTDLTF